MTSRSTTISPSRIKGLNVVKAEAAGCDEVMDDEELIVDIGEVSEEELGEEEQIVLSS